LLRDLIALAPELQKRLGKPFYEADQLEALVRPARESKGQALMELNNMTLRCPEYIYVEAHNGIITRAGTRKSGLNGSWMAALSMLRAAYQLQAMATEAEEEDRGRTTLQRREYDRDHGFEHVRRDCPRAPMTINEARLSALLDSGAELNTIRLKTAQAAGLVVTSMPREMASSRMQAANGTFEMFSGMVWRALVSIGNITILTNFFVLKSLLSPVILGNPFLADA
jgi:hypothetical protein